MVYINCDKKKRRVKKKPKETLLEQQERLYRLSKKNKTGKFVTKTLGQDHETLKRQEQREKNEPYLRNKGEFKDIDTRILDQISEKYQNQLNFDFSKMMLEKKNSCQYFLKSCTGGPLIVDMRISVYDQCNHWSTNTRKRNLITKVFDELYNAHNDPKHINLNKSKDFREIYNTIGIVAYIVRRPPQEKDSIIDGTCHSCQHIVAVRRPMFNNKNKYTNHKTEILCILDRPISDEELAWVFSEAMYAGSSADDICKKLKTNTHAKQIRKPSGM